MTRKLIKALAIFTLIGFTLSAYSAFAQEWGRSPTQRSVRGRDDRTEAPAPSPQGRQADDQEDIAARYPDEVRSIDGMANNFVNPLWGSAGVEYLRLTTVAYADGSSEPSGDARPNAREISNASVAYCKYKITISKSQIRSNSNCLVRRGGSVDVICRISGNLYLTHFLAWIPSVTLGVITCV